MELKQYQKRTIADLKKFINLLQEENNLNTAFSKLWELKGVKVGSNQKMPSYQNIIPGVPHVCFKVPTGGGKTFLACNSIKPVFDAMSENRVKVVLWMVPSDEILNQTIRNLIDPNHPYRQKINVDFQNRVEIFTKEQLLFGQNFNPSSVNGQLSVCVLSYDSFRSSRKEGRKAYQENGYLSEFPEILGKPEVPIQEADETSLIQILNQFNPLVIVDESHHARSELSIEMLKNFNPCFVLDLTATPKKESNLISVVSALQLKQENMVKLPVIVYNRANKEQVIANAIDMQRTLEQLAIREKEENGTYIRPIVLFQAQPKGNQDNTTFELLKEKLISVGIPREQIAIKTAEIKELNKYDLFAEDCPIRFIITINALKEGWDCPFAYILASLSNKASSVDVEQILGRILRLPNTKQHSNKFLNISYVLTSSAMFETTLGNIVKGLNFAGFSDQDYRAVQVAPDEEPQEDASENELFTPNGSEDENDFSDAEVKNLLETDGRESEPAREDIFAQASDASDEYEESLAQTTNTAGEDGVNQMTLGNEYVSTQYSVNNVFKDEIRELKLPQFYYPVPQSLFSEESHVLLKKSLLAEGFALASQDCNLSWDAGNSTLAKVDVEESNDTTPKFLMLSSGAKSEYLKMFSNLSASGQELEVREKICDYLGQINELNQKEILEYATRIINNLTPAQKDMMQFSPFSVAQKAKDKVRELMSIYAYERFKMLLDQGKIVCKASYQFPQVYYFSGEEMPLANALYSKEQIGNHFEQKFITAVASLDNIRWWHRNIESTGYYINGPFNHYPDFIIKTTRGNILIVETKGDDRDNSDSMLKLEMGKRLESNSQLAIKYFMVFDQNPFGGKNGAYTINDFIPIIKAL